ncbi:DUF922 domain-containing protein [Aurantibacter sp.]|uniref:DUF922 domain-containing protein n=1 Tax=Aurantibacter sp. TaxID=2807103 RepID=UPI0035C79035
MYSVKLIFTSILFTLCFQQDTELVWQKERALVWGDFQAKPIKNSPAAAVTASGLTFSYSLSKQKNQIIGFETMVISHFYPEHSWCKKDEITDHILSHEQFHFNITELHARLLRKEFSTLKVNPKIAKEITDLHKKVNKDLDAMQNAYDSQTDYSRNHDQQLKWEEKIRMHINLLDSYKL